MFVKIKFTIDNYTKILFFLSICYFMVCIPLLQFIKNTLYLKLCLSASPCIFRDEISIAIYQTTWRGYLGHSEEFLDPLDFFFIILKILVSSANM